MRGYFVTAQVRAVVEDYYDFGLEGVGFLAPRKRPAHGNLTSSHVIAPLYTPATAAEMAVIAAAELIFSPAFAAHAARTPTPSVTPVRIRSAPHVRALTTGVGVGGVGDGGVVPYALLLEGLF